MMSIEPPSPSLALVLGAQLGAGGHLDATGRRGDVDRSPLPAGGVEQVVDQQRRAGFEDDVTTGVAALREDP